ncbi:MAG: acyltransferase, partial [Deltaproteobacteria bacterium]|nr:acyltransferase [Deltaproteobacteria bacterium]
MKTGNHEPLAYRPDIDGLRAFAVLSVVAYHAFPETVKGGFIGVDVFFVISGYLIGGIILRDLEQGTFSFWNFYSRRIRRIFPALIVVLASALAFGWFALLPDEFKSLGKHVLGGSTFVSNFVLWQEAGYFDVEAKAKPLLHLWSLGIEEQFYIFFPLLLWLCHRKGIGKFPCIVILVACSFLYNLSLHTADRTADFYSPLTRIWELLAGVLCTMAVGHQEARPKPFCASSDKETGDAAGKLGLPCAFLGLSCLVISLCSINDQMPYPGWRALTPVVGAICLLGAGNRNVINNYLFSNRIAVFIGKVSYPFYLWHWVLLSFAFIVHGGLDSGDFALRVWLVCLSFVFAVVTYFFIEKPIRFNQQYRTVKIASLIIFMIVLGCSGVFIFITEGKYCRLTGLKNSKV